MKTKRLIQRREFLRTTGAAGMGGWLSSAALMHNFDARAGAASAKLELVEKLMTQLETISSQYPSVPKEEGRFLNLLLKATRARRVLEVGTAHGYTTIWLALALEETGGSLTTIEILPERVELARKHVAEAGLSHRVRFEQGDAHEIVPKLASSFDIAYLDADKGGQVDYFNKLFPRLLMPGGLLLAHNAILLADKMKDYLELVRNHPDFDTITLRAIEDDGLAVSYRKRKTS